MGGSSGDLFPGLQQAALVIVNGQVQVRTQDGFRVVTGRGVVLAHYAVGDRMAEAHAMVSLVEDGWATQVEVARGFGCSVRSVRRHQRRFEEGGLAALGRPSGYPKGRPRLPPSRANRTLHFKEKGLTNRQVARRMGVSEKAVRKTLRRVGWVERSPVQLGLPLGGGADAKVAGPPAASPVASQVDEAGAADGNLSGRGTPPAVVQVQDPPAPPAPPPQPDLSLDNDAADRRLDRLLACLGLLDDAAPLFRDGSAVPRAGVLLAIPALLDSGAVEIAHSVYGSIGPAFYGLRTTIVTLVLTALLRIKRPEGFKEHSPVDLGRLLGLDRAPEVKTVRRKLARLAGFKRAVDFGRALARHRAARLGSALGFLYVDGHVRVYHGHHELPKAHVAQARLSLPATTDYWVNDQR